MQVLWVGLHECKRFFLAVHTSSSVVRRTLVETALAALSRTVGAKAHGWDCGPFELSSMPKTAAQKAARKARRKARAQQPQPRQRPPARKPKRNRQPGVKTKAGIRGKLGESILAMAMSLPSDYPSIRFPTVDMPRTSVLTGKDVYTFSNPTTSAAGFNNGDMLIAVYGQPGRGLVTFANATVAGAYNLHFSSNAGSGIGDSNTWEIIPVALNTSASFETYWPATYASNPAGTGPHGYTLAIGLSDNVGYVFLDNNDSLSLGVTTWTSSAVGSAVFDIYKYSGLSTPPNLVSEKFYTLVSGNIPAGALYTAIAAGYYTVRFNRIDITSGSITSGANVINMALLANAGNRWSQYTISEVDAYNGGDTNIGADCRVNAFSCLVTNTSSQLNAQGNVVAARIRNPLHTEISPKQLARAAEKYYGKAALGCYTFKEFSSEAEVFNTTTNVDTKGIVFNLDYDDYIYFMQITNPVVATAANNFEVSVQYTLEFKTEVQRYTKGVSELNYTSLIEARKLINDKPDWFYENPLHMRDIYNLIKRGVVGAGRMIGRAAPYMGTAASALDPSHAAGYSALAQLLSNLNVRR